MTFTKKMRKFLKFFQIILVLSTGMAIIYLTGRYSFSRVPSSLALPGDIATGSHILVDWSYQKGRELKVGDNVVFFSESTRKNQIGQIAAIPNMQISESENRLAVGGKISIFPYPPLVADPYVLTSGQYLLYRDLTSSARDVGEIIHCDHIKGRVLLVFRSSQQAIFSR